MKYDWLVLRPARHRGRAVRRHDADVLRARCRRQQRRPRHGRALPSATSATSRSRSRTSPAPGRSFIGFARVPIDKATDYAAEDADVTLRLWRMLKPRLSAERRDHRLRDAGAAAGRDARPHGAARHRASTATSCRGSRASSRRAWRGSRRRSTSIAGEPLQPRLARSSSATSCSARWACPAARRPPTGAWSTAASVLDDLAEEGNDLPRMILDWRQLSKLKSTYTDALPAYVNPTHAPRPHLLRAGRHHHGAAVLVRAEPAEHPDPQRGGPQDPHAPSSRRPATS